MKYNLTIIDSDTVYDYWNNSAQGIRYSELKKDELDKLIELSLKQNFSVIIQNSPKEE